MTAKDDRAVFLEKASYRQRRLRDTLRMLPVLGVILWLMPLLWESGGAEASRTVMAVKYVFGVWMFLIVFAGGLAFFGRKDATADADEDTV